MLDVARVGKPHGLQGEVVVDLWTDVTERLEPGSELFGPDGRRLVIRSARPFQHRHLVRFEGVADRAGAQSLTGVVLQAPPTDVEGALWVHELVGTKVVDTDGRELGRVVAVEANPASDLLVLERGELVPLRFVVDHRPGERVTVNVPAGLVD